MTSPQTTTPYPLVATNEEEALLDGWIKEVRKKLSDARQAHDQALRSLGPDTKMYLRQRRNWFGLYTMEQWWYDVLGDHILRAVLLVATRYLWAPEEVLALCQIEGLLSPKNLKYEQATAGPWLAYKPWYKQRGPRDEREARTWARSAVLYQRWGLDRLASVRYDDGDNQLLIVGSDEHDQAFEDGFAAECAHALGTSPLMYFTADDGPFRVRKSGRNWQFQTDPAYQPTMLALQHTRFIGQAQRIPQILDVKKVRVHTRPLFAALLYLFFNSRGAQEHLEKSIAGRLVAEGNASNSDREPNGDDLYAFFVSKPIPPPIERYVEQHQQRDGLINSHGYVNALRFEFLRQTYLPLFQNLKDRMTEQGLLGGI